MIKKVTREEVGDRSIMAKMEEFSIPVPKVLIVDDRKENLIALRKVLQDVDAEIVDAISGNEALAATLDNDFALAILDVQMPEMDGYELSKLLRSDPRTSDIPIIFLTAAFDEEEQIYKGYMSGGVDYIIKPYNPAMLIAKVNIFLELNRKNLELVQKIEALAASRRQLQDISEELRKWNENLEETVAERTREVRQKADHLRALASQLSRTEQREKKRLSKILHDHIQQLIVAAKMHMSWMNRDDDPEFQTMIKNVESILHEALEACRSLTVDLSPPVLHEAGLIGGLNWLASRMHDKNQFKVHLQTEIKAEPASEDTRFMLFECARELLFNVVKHAEVDQAHVILERLEGNLIRLMISDKGKGFDPAHLGIGNTEEMSFGLFSIRERLAYLGGKIEIESAPGKGTRIILIVPDENLKSFPGTVENTCGKEPAETIQINSCEKVCRLMICDDHKIMRQGLVKLLQFEPDMEIVAEAEDGQQAVEHAAKLKPDIIIMDVNMPIINGIKATREIVDNDSRVKVIGLSIHSDDEVAKAMREAGAYTYLSKTGPAEDLIATIRTAARQQIISLESIPNCPCG
jgi:signal transduction histidine kinase